MSKRYELFIPASFESSAREVRLSKNSFAGTGEPYLSWPIGRSSRVAIRAGRDQGGRGRRRACPRRPLAAARRRRPDGRRDSRRRARPSRGGRPADGGVARGTEAAAGRRRPRVAGCDGGRGARRRRGHGVRRLRRRPLQGRVRGEAAGDARARRARRAARPRTAAGTRHAPRRRGAQPRKPAGERPDARGARAARTRRGARPPARRGTRSRLDRVARDGSLRRRRGRQPTRPAADRDAVRAARCASRPHPRTRGQGAHVRFGRDLAEAASAHAGHEGRHVRRRGGDRGDGGDRRARAADSGPDRRRSDRERPGRGRVQAGRHPPRSERQDDRGDQHGRRRPARAGRRAPLRARERRHAPRRLRDADGRDGARVGRPLRRLVLHRRRVRRCDRARVGVERRPGMALPLAPALPPLHRLRVRGHEERVGAPRGEPDPRRRVPARVRGTRSVGPLRHQPRVPEPQTPRLRARRRGHRVRRAADRRPRGGAALSLDFDLDDEHLLLRDTVRQFALERIAPVAEELDREKRFPYELVAELAELGLMGMTIPEEYGGGGTDTLAYAIAIEELARVDSSVAITVAAHHSLGTLPIWYFGTEEQKREWVPDLASGRRLAAFGLTEPGAGSDAGATRTTARLEDGEWVIDGSKIFITNAGTDITACVTITARTGEDEISNLIVPNGTGGYVISPPMQKLGWRASDTRELSFQGARVPEGNLLGPRGDGFRQFLQILDGGRISVAAMAVGLAQGCYDLALAYAREREQFGAPISRFQAVQEKLVDMAT